jgi:hypothetical protein
VVTKALTEHEGDIVHRWVLSRQLIVLIDLLKTLFIVSDTAIVDEGSTGSEVPKWLYSQPLDGQGDSPFMVKLIGADVNTFRSRIRTRGPRKTCDEVEVPQMLDLHEGCEGEVMRKVRRGARLFKRDARCLRPTTRIQHCIFSV